MIPSRPSLAVLLLVAGCAGSAVRDPLLDAQGDPLPPGAVARLGTTRFRPGSWVFGMTYSPDGRLIATAGQDRRVCIWDAGTGKRIQDLSGHEAWAWGVDFSSDGKVLASVADDDILILWDVHTGKEILREKVESTRETVTGSGIFMGYEWTYRPTAERRLIEVGGHGLTAALSPDGRWLADPVRMTLRNAQTGEPARRFPSEHSFMHVTFSPDGSLLAGWSGSYCFPGPGPLCVWEVETGRRVLEKWGHDTPPSAAAFSPDREVLATASDDGTLRLWRLPGGEALTRVEGHFGWAPWIAFSPDDLSIATGGNCSGSSSAPEPADPSIRIWDVPTGKPIVTREGCGPVEYLPGGTYLASGDVSGYLGPDPRDPKVGILRDAGTGRAIRNEGVPVHCLVASRGTPDTRVVLLDAFPHEENPVDIQLIDGTRPPVARDLATVQGIPVLTPDGRRLAAMTKDEEARIWNLETMEETSIPATLGSWSFFTGEGRLLTMDSDGEGLVLRNVVTKEVMARWEGEDWGFALDRNHRRLASWPTGEEWGPADLVLRDLITGEEVARLPHAHRIDRADLSPGGDWAISLVEEAEVKDDIVILLEKSLRLWDCRTGNEILRIGGPDPWKRGRAFSDDGTLLGLVTEDGIIRVVDTESGEEVVTFDPGGARADHLAFSKDKRMLACACADATILIWELDGGDAGDPWEALGGADAVAAGRAFREMVEGGDETVAFISEKLLPVRRAVDPEIRRWVQDLDDADFTVREEASRMLRENLDAAEGEILRAADGDPSVEARVRIEDLLGIVSIPRVLPPGERARVWRAIAVLERIGSERARGVLRVLATDLGRAIERQAARDALLHLEVSGARVDERD